MSLCRIKKSTLFFVFFFIFSVFFPKTAFAKIFEISAAGGIRNSTVSEFVYQEDFTLSRLDWNMPLIPVMNISGRFNFFNALLDFSASSAIPETLGSMQDYDWLGEDKTKYTNFSEHALFLNTLYDLEAKVGYDFNLQNLGLPVNLSIIPQGGILYRNQKFEAYNGYSQYAEYEYGEYWNESIEKKYLSGSMITYKTELYMPFFSLETSYTIDNFFTIKLFGRFFPYIFATAIDNHYFRLYQFNDYMNKGQGFSIGTEIGKKNFSLLLNYECFKCKGGKTKYRSIGNENKFIDADSFPGLESSVFSAMIILCI